MVERAQTPAPVVVGMVIEQRWRLEGGIGSGGMAEVFRATDLHTGRPVAVKVLRGSLESSPEAVQRFRREGELLVRLKNPAIVAADTIASLPDGRLYMVMELLEGETLGARLKRGPMSAAELAPIVAGCSVALAAAHAFGVVHRDLKPDNVFLARRADGTVQVKLLDFGVSKVFNGEKLTQTGQVLGTPRYMSPEQLGAEPEVDHRVDLYSLGVILYEALSGRSPFLASTPTDLIVAILHGKAVPLRSVRPDVPPALEAVVMRAMAKVRDARHRAATELAEAFFEAAGIDARVRPAQRHGMATTPLGAMRASPDASPLDDARPVATADEGEGALKVGTFSSFEAIDIDRVLAAHSTAPAPVGIGAQLGATAPDPRSAQRSAVAAAATVLAPGGASADARARQPPPIEAAPAAPRREIPATALSPIMPHVEPAAAAGSTRREPWAGGRPRDDASGAVPHQDAQAAYPGRVSRSSSASIGGAYAPRPIADETPQRSQGLLLVAVGLVAGALTAGVVVAVLTWVTQMSPGEGRTPPPPPPPAALYDAGPADTAPSGASTAAATGAVVVPGATRSAAGTTTAESGATGASEAGAPGGGASAAAGSAAASSTETERAEAGAAASGAGASSGGSSGSSSTSAGSSGSSSSGSGSTSAGSSGTGSTSAGSSGTGSTSAGSSGSSSSGSGSTSSGGSSAGRSGTSRGGSGGGAAASDEAASSAAATLTEATRALARGDYAECVDILDDVIARGGTPVALRRRADCLMRMGEIREATRDYQRFCRLAPDHPAISEVRGILAGMGATCP